MFNLSSAVTTCIAIYPNSNDSWDVLSPFPGDTLELGEEAFVLSNSKKNNNGLLHLLQDRLIDIGKGSNKIDFIAKTNLKQQTTPESSGIGGMSKLKDFNFSILKNYGGYNNMETRDILALYGRTVVIFLTDTDSIEDINKSKVFFKGEIYSAKRKDEEIKFIVRGLLNTANPLVGGAIIEISDGTQKNEAIVFGDSGDMYIPISKKKIGEKHILQFSQSDKYIIKDLYVKTGSDEEPIFSKVDTAFDIVDNEIIFDTERFSSLTLGEMKVVTYYISKISVKTNYEIGVHYIVDPDLGVGKGKLSAGDICYYEETGVTPIKEENRLIFIGVRVIDRKNIYFFKCGWEFIYGRLGEDLADPTVSKNIYKDYYTTSRLVDYVIFDTERNPLEKAIDALPYDNAVWNYKKELKDVINGWDQASIKLFQSIPSEGLVIKIDDEEMLVIYTEKDSYYPTSNYNSATLPNKNPEEMWVYVVRGWNNTDAVIHNLDTTIKILSNEASQEIRYTLVRQLQSLTTVSPGLSFVPSNFNKFLNGEKKLTVQNRTGVDSGKPNVATYIGLDFKLPDLDGKLEHVTLIGEATCNFMKIFNSVFDYNDSIAPDKDRTCSINLALNVPEDINDEDIKKRRIFGINKAIIGEHILNISKWYIAYFHLETDTPDYYKSFQGKYEHVLTGSWKLHSDTSTVPREFEVRNKTHDVDINDYDELKKTSMYIVFNASNIKKNAAMLAFQSTLSCKTEYTLSRPDLHVTMKVSLSDVDIYAKVIPVSIFDDPHDTFSIGDNCKICWHPINWDGKMATEDKKNTVIVSDNTFRKFGYVNLDGNGLTFSIAGKEFTPNNKGAGYLVKNVVEYNDNGKVYLSSLEKEHYKKNGDTPFQLSSGIPDGLFNVGKNLIENGSCYIWVDQDNGLLKLSLKENIDMGNPVKIIQTLLNEYYDNVTLNDAAFSIAIDKRKGWVARLLVENETRLVTLIDKISKEHGLISYENNVGEMSIAVLDPPVIEEVDRDIDGSEIMYKGKVIDFSEKYTDFDYLITVLDVYYNFVSNKYKGYIKSDELSDQTSFDVAKDYSENEIKIKLQLQSVFEQTTADNCAMIKMIYHTMPTRIITVKTTLSTSDIELAQWVSCSSSKITEVGGKIYLVMGKGEQPPFRDKKPYIELILFEYDWNNIVKRIQEVPKQSIVDNYDEVPDTIEDIDEIPNA